MLEAPREFETERLLLRQLREEDLDAYAGFMADPIVMEHMGGVSSRADAWRHIAVILGHWQLRGFGMYAVCEKGSGRFVGRIGPNFPESWPDREIGWLLGREFWGKGYASEAAAAMRDMVFETLGWNRLVSLIAPGNVGSEKVAERIGESLTDEIFWVRGQFETRVFALKRSAWERSRA